MSSLDFERSIKDKDSFAIVGGGPAGSFFAICLLREARRLKKEIEVVIVEKKAILKIEDDYWWINPNQFFTPDDYLPWGCSD